MSIEREITYSTGETSELTGASQKQIRYWIERGHVQSDRNVCGLVAYRRFTQSKIENICEIKGYLDQGYTLAFITNALDANETMGFVQNQVGHSSIKPIVNHYYNRIPRDEDGQKLEEAFKNAQVLPDLEED